MICAPEILAPAASTLRFERRHQERQPVRGSVMAAFTDTDDGITLTRVDLVDASNGGLGLLCPVRVEPGARFALYAPEVALPHTTGVVARCTDSGDEAFRIGLRCDARLAA